MADLNNVVELTIGVNVKDVDKALPVIKRLERDIINATKQFDKGTMSQKRFNAELNKSRNTFKDYSSNAGLASVRVNKLVNDHRKATSATKAAADATKKASNELKAFAAARREATEINKRFTDAETRSTVATKKEAVELERLRDKFVKGHIAMKIYSKGLNELAVARKAGIITTQQQTAATAQLNAQMMAGAGAFASAGKGAGMAKNKMNGMNMVVQQAGYQFGDFAVQVQGGTSAFVAFSQQGAQLAGMLPMIAGPLGISMGLAVGLSAALGILIPIIGAVGRMFMEMGSSAKDSASSAEALNERIKAIINSLKEYKRVKEAAGLGVSLEFMDLTAQISQAQELVTALKAVVDANKNIPAASGEEGAAQLDAQMKEKDALGKLTEAKTQLNLLLEKEGEIKDSNFAKGSLALTQELALIQAKEKYGSDSDEALSAELDQELRLRKAAIDARVEAGELDKNAGAAMKLQVQSIHELNALLREGEKIKSESTAHQEAKDALVIATQDVKLQRTITDELDRQEVMTKRGIIFDRIKGKITAERADELLALVNTLTDEQKLLRASVKDAKDLAAGLKEAATAMSNLTKFGENIEKSIAKATAEVEALKEGGNKANASMIAGLEFELEVRKEIALATAVGSDAKQAAIDTYEASLERIAVLAGLIAEKDLLAAKSPTGSKGGQTNEQYIAQLIREIKQKKSLIGLSKEEVKVATLRNKIKEKGIKLTDENVQVLLKEQAELIESTRISEDYQAMISDIRTGLTDAFTSVIEGTKSVGSAFKDMIRQMLMSLAQKSFIQPLVGAITGGASASMSTQAIASGGSSLLGGSGTFAAGASALGSGLYAGAGSALGFGSSASVVASAELATGAMGAFGTSLGAIAGPLAVAAVAISFLSSKTKLLDSGLKGTVTNMDATIESFEKLQKSRFFGLSKSVSTKGSLLSDEDAAPMIEAIKEIQMSVMDAAGQFGIANDVFDNFTHDFKLSLKGLSEEAKKAAIAEEFTKMGDAFAQMTEHFETMAEAIEAANQRMALQNRLDTLLGNNAAILARQREAEIKAVHELNKELLVSIHRLEDAQVAFAQADQAVGEAFKALRLAIDAEKKGITDAFTSLLDGLKIRLDAANEVMKRTQTIVNMLEGALSGRSVTQGLEQKFARREGALNFIRGGDFEDEQMLRDALSVVGEPTEQLFGSFVEYAREFGRTSLVLEQARGIAQFQLTAAEEAVIVLERQIEASEEANESQLAALDERYILAEKEYAALLGIDTSIMSVEAAIANLAVAMQAAIDALAAQRAAAAAAAVVAATPAVQTPTTTSTTTETAEAQRRREMEFLNGSAAAAENKANDESQSRREMAELSARSDAIRDARAAASGEDNGSSGSSSFSQAVSSGWDKVSDFFGFATGGDHTGGLRMVGERGPELEATGPSRIFSNKQTSKMFSNPELVEEIRGLRSEVSGLRSEQRQMQASSSKYVKRNYEINRKWDVDGLPATRT